MDEPLIAHIAPGHIITGNTDGTMTRELVTQDGETRLQPVQRWFYSCSCGEIDVAGIADAEAHIGFLLE